MRWDSFRVQEADSKVQPASSSSRWWPFPASCKRATHGFIDQSQRSGRFDSRCANHSQCPHRAHQRKQHTKDCHREMAKTRFDRKWITLSTPQPRSTRHRALRNVCRISTTCEGRVILLFDPHRVVPSSSRSTPKQDDKDDENNYVPCNLLFLRSYEGLNRVRFKRTFLTDIAIVRISSQWMFKGWRNIKQSSYALQ